MRIYIIEDDTSVIGVLEDIVEGNQLGTICGDSGGGPADLQQILALAPDLILVDLLMPQKDGIQVVRELKEQGCTAKFIMISQVSSKARPIWPGWTSSSASPSTSSRCARSSAT